MFDVRGKTVLVTGASMGMGRLFALRAADEGAARVLLWDIDANSLAQTAALVREREADAVETMIDLSAIDAIRPCAERSLATHGAPDVIINNAGIVRGNAYFWETDPARDIDPVIAINTLAPMHLTRALLPAMLATPGEKRILDIASAAATLSNPRMSVYAASKWAMLGWSDSLRLELEQAGHAHVKVTTFCPSYIATGMFDGAKGPLMTPILRPEAALDAAWNGMRGGVPIVMRPWTTHLAKMLKGVLPLRLWDVVAGKVFGVYNSMDHFKGRH